MSSSKTYARRDFIKGVSKKLSITIQQASAIVEAYESQLDEALRSDLSVNIGNMVHLKRRVRAATVRRNPKTGEKVECPETYTIKCKMYKDYSNTLDKDLPR